MCGIVACIINDKAAPVLLECIRRLEYRGYDSVGLATLSGDIYIKKGEGKINDVHKRLDLTDIPGNMGIAHVRWATHGLPTSVNAHPQTDCKNRIALVHNGIIENYRELKTQLKDEGHIFTSETDTEILAHLIEKYMKIGNSLEVATRLATKDIKGSYAIAVISKDEPNKIIGVRKESPLIVGAGEKESFIASDVPAILKHTKNVIYLNDNEMVILSPDGVIIKDIDGNTLKNNINIIEWTSDMAEKGGFKHFMLKEIHEQPDVIKNTLMDFPEIKKVVAKFSKFKRICFIACGTSFHASIIGKYLFETLLGIPTDVMLSSEFIFSQGALDKNTLVILITQSGETADTLKALKIANKKSETLAIVNVLGSTITREADHIIYTRAGPEIGVASTKTYVSQLVSIYMLVIAMSENNKLLTELHKVPDYIKQVLEDEDHIIEIAKKYKDANDFFFIGRGFSYPTALEGALKLKEITYIHGEGYAAGELKHGPIALIDDNIPVLAIVPPGKSHDKTLSNIEEVKARGAKIISVGSSTDEILKSESHDIMGLEEDISEILSPIPYVVPLQLLSYYISVERGIDPDKPKNLAKCVTVE
ncbi:MAG: glutamine--fructose-6-phosphate transaminase (isomerizing) [Methanobacterium sp.]|nr:glutamine--fructose-6-phosphate transaminase (isomerizing) [Methanobacterium sp.]